MVTVARVENSSASEISDVATRYSRRGVDGEGVRGWVSGADIVIFQIFGYVFHDTQSEVGSEYIINLKYRHSNVSGRNHISKTYHQGWGPLVEATEDQR
ncbi:hypothetical protein TB1_005067 [Malus domestica]